MELMDDLRPVGGGGVARTHCLCYIPVCFQCVGRFVTGGGEWVSEGTGGVVVYVYLCSRARYVEKRSFVVDMVN